ncbi:hypothetical protein [Sphingomicrobium sediminis]|uniref:Uncharacterized protein n=1 Tax=Sphingomicrobium sediminis TaxID=2950949 RepID=A0A9X2EEL6_9SPHN|nr:hypothetical protein [Sphingomicrobium sediminis]MCM8556545.1 hypothetical protein [Sphingomicrobium sediminis]
MDWTIRPGEPFWSRMLIAYAVIFTVPITMALFAPGMLPQGRLFLLLLFGPTGAFVTWRIIRKSRAMGLRDGRSYEKYGRQILPPEYCDSEDGQMAAYRRRVAARKAAKSKPHPRRNIDAPKRPTDI